MLRSDLGAGGKFFEWLGEVGATKENSHFFAPLSVTGCFSFCQLCGMVVFFSHLELWSRFSSFLGYDFVGHLVRDSLM